VRHNIQTKFYENLSLFGKFYREGSKSYAQVTHIIL